MVFELLVFPGVLKNSYNFFKGVFNGFYNFFKGLLEIITFQFVVF